MQITRNKPLAIDLFAGLGGWTAGLLAEGYDVVGFDIERHAYGDHRYPAQLVLQDVRTIHGSQFANASLIVASPPCQEFSYMAMPWTRAKKIAAEYRDGLRDPKKLTELFDACFRIQREAIAATRRTCHVCRGEAVTSGNCRCERCDGKGWEERFIPLVVENVRGAQPWVGRARWMYGSFALWGDVPALMPITTRRAKVGSLGWSDFAKTGVKSKGFNTTADQLAHGRASVTGTYFEDDSPCGTCGELRTARGGDVHCVGDCDDAFHDERDGCHRFVDTRGVELFLQMEAAAFGPTEGVKIGGARGDDWFTHYNRPEFEDRATKNNGGSWFNIGSPGQKETNRNPVHDGVKQGGDLFNAEALDDGGQQSISRRSSSKSSARKAASALIAKIPFRLARHIAATYFPKDCRR